MKCENEFFFMSRNEIYQIDPGGVDYDAFER